MAQHEIKKHSDYKTMQITDYDRAIEYLYSLELFGIKLGLDNIRRIMDRLGNPQEGLKFVHVAGTNGKGSVCVMLSSVLKSAGYKTGLYTSPHLRSFRERITVNGERIPRERVVALTRELQAIALEIEAEHEAHPTYFEITTAMALKHFAEAGIDIAVIEVGMGGRFDATNIIEPELCVITDISKDHSEYLGDTLEKIAYEKAGIIKPGVQVVTSAQNHEIMAVIEKRAGELKAPLTVLGKDFSYELIKADDKGINLNFYFNDNTDRKFELNELHAPLLGRFQAQNCAVAAAAVALLTRSGINISTDAIYEGVSKVDWPARLQVMQSSPTVIIDCSHNPKGVRALVDSIKELFSFNKITLVIGMVKEKERAEMLDALVELKPEVVTVRPDTHRALDPKTLCSEFASRGVVTRVLPDILEGVGYAVHKAGPDDMVIITGSFYTAGAALEYWN
jgi:dihydrofolate synthase/folylpolyglutamate synthase